MTVGAVTGASLTALGVAGALAAYRHDRRWAYGGAKGLASLGFLVVALAAGATAEVWTRWALAALVLSAVGDVALAVRSRRGFVAGLAAFLAAHLAFAVAFVVRGVAAWPLAVAALAVAAALALGGRAWGPRVPAGMRTPVAAYAVVLGSMAALALATGAAQRTPALVVGALLVALSDLAVARERFATQGFVNKAIGLPTYYLGQTLVAVALAGP